MTNIKGIERLEGRGITAKVVDEGNLYSTYQEFAEAIGYPDAAYELFGDRSKEQELRVRLLHKYHILAKGEHGSFRGENIYVIESEDGERFLIGEEGLEITYPEENNGQARLATLKQAEESLAELRRQAYAEGYEQGFKQATFDAKMEKAFDEVSGIVNGNNSRETGRGLLEKQRKETAQENRDRIVEQAKEVRNVNGN